MRYAGLFILLILVILIGCKKEEPKPNIPPEVREYAISDPVQCKTADLKCKDNEAQFFDEKGCGCIASKNKLIRHYCSDSDRKAKCNGDEATVCGWFGRSVLCFNYPCAQDYKNACSACTNENVAYYTDSICPVP